MRRASILAAAVALLCLAAPPPAQATYVAAGEFSGMVSYSSPLTQLVGSRSATLTTWVCTEQGLAAPNKGPTVIQLLGTCSVTLTMQFNVSSAGCLPVGFTLVSGSYSGTGGTWSITSASVAARAVFGGVALVVQGTVAQNVWPAQTGPFTLTAQLTPAPAGACLTNVSQSSAIGEFQLGAV